MARTGKNSGSRLDRHSIRAQFTGPLEWTRIAIRRRRLQRSGRDGDGADAVFAGRCERGYGRRPEHYAARGGREGSTVIQRYPDDYDGVVANVPALNFSGLRLIGVRIGQDEYSEQHRRQMPHGVPSPSRSNGCKRERAGQACSVSRILRSRFPGPHSCRTGTCFLRAMLTSSISSRMTRRSIRRTSMSCGRDVTVNKWSGCRRRSVRLDDWVTHGVAPETPVVTDIAQATNGRRRRCAGIRRFRGRSGKGKPIGPVVLFVRGSEAIRVSWGALAAWLQLESKY